MMSFGGIAFCHKRGLSIDLGLLYGGPLYQVVEVLVNRLCLQLIWLQDRLKHHGCCGHVLPEVEEILRSIAAFSE
jgi:hypothetical protein